MSRYLEEAAELLRKAVETNEHTFRNSELAAIDKGLLPDRLVRKYLEGGEAA